MKNSTPVEKWHTARRLIPVREPTAVEGSTLPPISRVEVHVFAGAELVDLLEDYPDSEVLEMEPDAYKGQYTHIIGDTVTPEVLCKVQAAVEGWDRHQIHTRTFYDISECTDSEIENMPVPDSAADEWALMYDDLSESVDVEVEEIREQAKWYGILSVYRSE